ncbi:MAG: aspartate aminotransferase family protein [Micrococcales bacterium]|nr:aspartate aminotransferase family protein [Micrococcales bacterium]
MSGDLARRREEHLGSSYRLFYDDPVHVVRGEGVWLYDADGRRYLDAYNNVAGLGHCHPRVVAALAEQAARLNTHTRYLGHEVVDYAERLLGTFPAHLDQVVLTCTGSEANDLAYRVARVATGGTGFVVTEHAYHGVTHAVAGLSPSYGGPDSLGQDVWTVPAPRTAGDAEAFAAAVQAAVDQMRSRSVQPAALLVDSILASDGIYPEALPALEAGAAVMRAAGGLLIVDEVQPGFGRTGRMWHFTRSGLTPDLVSLGKPMGNGHPIAGLVARRDVLDEFGSRQRYFNTFGGNAVSCAVGSAVLDVIEDEGLLERAAARGERLVSGLREVGTRHTAIGEVRGIGLYAAVELRDDHGAPAAELAGRVVNGMRSRGVLLSTAGPSGHVLKLRPPLVSEDEHIDLLLETLDATLDHLRGGPPVGSLS